MNNQPVPPEQAAPPTNTPAPSAGGPAAPAGGGSKILIILLVIALVLALAAAGYFWWQTTKTNEESGATPTSTASAVTSPSIQKTATRTGGASPVASTQPTATEEKPIVVTAPAANQLVSSPVLLTGSAIAFENTIYARIKDSNGQILGTVTITTEASDVGLPGKYSASLTFSTPTTDTGAIEVYETDAATGKDKSIVTIQVRFR